MNLRVIWEGNLPLKKIKWGKKHLSEYKLPHKLDLKRREIWKHHLQENSDDYDGKLLFLKNFLQRNNKIILDIGLIRFSTVIFMVKNKISVNQGIGMLGTQCIIFSPCKKYILVGERPLSQSYYPGITTVPGGMLELDDLENKPKEAFMREIYEEAPLPFQSDASLYAVLAGWNNISVTFLTSITITEDYNFNPTEVIIGDKKEWKNNLRWTSLEDLKNLPSNKLLDGLTYFQLKIANSIEN
jgi:8-oxo-dGTP pyrophosphatase MutT (NUDIX family)